MRGNALGNWTIASAPGNNAARILAMFSDKQYMDLDTEWHETNDALVENTSRDCDDITNHTDNASGDDVANGTERKLFLRIDAPTDSDYDTAQTFRVTITAVASSTF